MNANGEDRWSTARKDDEWHLISDHQYILMKGCIYSGMRRKTVCYKDLTEQELLEIWQGDWVDNAERKKVLDHFGRRFLYAKAREAFEKDLLIR